MGHSWPSMQQAIRASAVGIHPAQTAAFPATKTKESAAAESRRTKVSTLVGCSTVALVSNRAVAAPNSGARLIPLCHAAKLPLLRALTVVLDKWASLVAVGAKDTAIAGFWLQHDMTALAFVKKHAPVQRHRLARDVSARRASDLYVEVSHATRLPIIAQC